MNWGVYGILIIFGLFVLLMVFNPRLSCFGRMIKSPLYPLLRKKSKRRKTEDYGFHIVDDDSKDTVKKGRPGNIKKEEADKKKKADDYGFHLD